MEATVKNLEVQDAYCAPWELTGLKQGKLTVKIAYRVYQGHMQLDLAQVHATNAL